MRDSDYERLAAAAGEVLASGPVAFAYLFGSSATGHTPQLAIRARRLDRKFLQDFADGRR